MRISSNGSREVAKIAVLYVGENQEDEATILKNEHGSKDYHDFITALGWKVDIETHAGYKGGLECPMLQDGTATYHCDSLQEVIFHEATSMASDPGDPKQLKKKRHIGNDHVHVVWNDNWAQYKWDTIGGDFGNAQISITPLPNGLYAIDVFRDTANNVLVLTQGR
ncbi:hypothetical protein EDD86DRAFT_130548 [Gorgonomyces haynaldii]|nr:hypothetical protein EDD86DRAFT_130548 [Gorgonomyces haynaldii]